MTGHMRSQRLFGIVAKGSTFARLSKSEPVLTLGSATSFFLPNSFMIAAVVEGGIRRFEERLEVRARASEEGHGKCSCESYNQVGD